MDQLPIHKNKDVKLKMDELGMRYFYNLQECSVGRRRMNKGVAIVGFNFFRKANAEGLQMGYQAVVLVGLKDQHVWGFTAPLQITGGGGTGNGGLQQFDKCAISCGEYCIYQVVVAQVL